MFHNIRLDYQKRRYGFSLRLSEEQHVDIEIINGGPPRDILDGDRPVARGARVVPSPKGDVCSRAPTLFYGASSSVLNRARVLEDRILSAAKHGRRPRAPGFGFCGLLYRIAFSKFGKFGFTAKKGPLPPIRETPLYRYPGRGSSSSPPPLLARSTPATLPLPDIPGGCADRLL